VSDIPELTNEFVEKLIGIPVSSFTITQATAPGDNYMSVLYCLRIIVKLQNGIESVIYAISKNYPAHPLRQSFLVKSNIFWNELCVYQNWIPALQSVVDEAGIRGKMKLPFAPLIGGASIDFGSGKDNQAAKYADRVFQPFDHYLLMTDMKNTHGFRMANRHFGLGYDEVSLVMAEHSKIHAISWAYKLKHGKNIIKEKFPNFHMGMPEDDKTMFEGMLTSYCNMAHDALKECLPEDSPILKSTVGFSEKVKHIMEMMFASSHARQDLELVLRVKPEKDAETRKADDVQWEVVVHGDCWVNNLLFRYDEKTKKAIELVLIDLQVMSDNCPTNDLVYLFYTSVSTEFRRKHMNEMLELYYNHFRNYCDQLGVEYLPGYSLEALKRRFHRSKLIGFMMCLMVLPIILKDTTNMEHLDKSTKTDDLAEMFNSIIGGEGKNVSYRERLLGVAQDLYDEGVI